MIFTPVGKRRLTLSRRLNFGQELTWSWLGHLRSPTLHLRFLVVYNEPIEKSPSHSLWFDEALDYIRMNPIPEGVCGRSPCLEMVERSVAESG